MAEHTPSGHIKGLDAMRIAHDVEHGTPADGAVIGVKLSDRSIVILALQCSPLNVTLVHELPREEAVQWATQMLRAADVRTHEITPILDAPKPKE